MKGPCYSKVPGLRFQVHGGTLYPSQFRSGVDVIVGVSVGVTGVFVGPGVKVIVGGSVFVGVGGGAL